MKWNLRYFKPSKLTTYPTFFPTKLAGNNNKLVIIISLLKKFFGDIGPFFLVFFIFGRMTKFLSRWQKIGCDDNWHCRVTNFLSSWQKFGHDDKKLVLRHGLNPDDHQQGCLYVDQTPIIINYAWTLIKSQSTKSRMFGHGLNCSNHHQGCLDMDKITIIIIKDARTWIKSP